MNSGKEKIYNDDDRYKRSDGLFDFGVGEGEGEGGDGGDRIPRAFSL